ncbi:MAG: tetratricopeptide repeat protein [Cyanobacteria bacterium]|nr:tetratricopeptide repeat protein [Cyanobacteriota bacterium]
MPDTRAASPKGIDRAKKALSRKGWTKSYLIAQVIIDDDNPLTGNPNIDQRVSPSTVKRFFQGKRIRAEFFGGICVALELDPNEIESGTQVIQLENRRWSVPYDRNPCLMGREQALATLRQTFGAWQDNTQPVLQAVSGLGGIGKTQIAVEYAYRYEQEYRAIFWVRADTESERFSSFVEIAQQLNLPSQATQPPQTIVSAVLNWLSRHEGWLLIFDNADQPEQLKAFRPRRGQGHILLTSRAQRFDYLGIVQPVRLDTLAPADAIAFLLKRTGRASVTASELTAVAEIAAELGYLPLALEQAAAYIRDRLSFEDYLTSYRQHHLGVLQRSGPVMGDYPASVATTWALNFQAVAAQSPGAAALLRVSAFWAADTVPYELLEQGCGALGEPLATTLATAPHDPSCIVDVLAPLARYSLVQLEPTARTYSLHRLVQAVVRADLATEQGADQSWAMRAIEAVGAVFPEVEYANWPQCDRLLPHALAGRDWIEQYGYQSEGAARLLNQAGQYLTRQGRYDEAEPLLLGAVAMRRALLGGAHLDVAMSLYNLGALYRAQGRYDEAESQYKAALAMRQDLLEGDHGDIAVSLNNLALLHQYQGRYDEAEAMQQRAIAMRQRLFGEDHEDLASSLSNLGLLYWKQARYAEAEPLLIKALGTYRRLMGEEHPAVATCLNNLGLLYKAQERYGEAEALYQQALAIYRRLMGESHPLVATSLNNLAALSKAKGEYDAAMGLYEQALVMRERLLGESHPMTVKTREVLVGLREA